MLRSYELGRALRLLGAVACMAAISWLGWQVQSGGEVRAGPRLAVAVVESRGASTDMEDVVLGAAVVDEDEYVLRQALPLAELEREVSVVDNHDVPVEGAQLFSGAVWDASGSLRCGTLLATTDSSGRARVPDVRPEDSISVIAPGHQVVEVRVPAPERGWSVQLACANRIEVSLASSDAVADFHIEIRFPDSFRQRTFYQQQYVQTPGRAVEGTRGWWDRQSDGSRWTLLFNAERRALLDQIYENGKLSVLLFRLGTAIEQRDLDLVGDGRALRVDFVAPERPTTMTGAVSDAVGMALEGVRLRLAPRGGRHTLDQEDGFPIWSPSTASAADGSFELPRPDDPAVCCVITKRGFADLVLSVAELDELHGHVRMAPGRVVLLEAVDRNGEALDAGWENGHGRVYARPEVLIAHDVWRGPSADDHPDVAGRVSEPPLFIFADLPAGTVRFRLPDLGDDAVLLHDTQIALAHFRSPRALEEIGLGK